MTSPTPTVRFTDSERSDFFALNGFVVIPGIDLEAIELLLAEHKARCPTDVSTMWSNVHELSAEDNQSIARLLTKALDPIIRRELPDYEVRGGTFLVKGRGEASVCHLHQDWNTVNEADHQALVAWVPLVDVDETNGCLVVAPGSHVQFQAPTVRGANIEDAHFHLDADLLARCTSVPLRAGDVCIFAQNLFHGSWPNGSVADRVALYAGVLPIGVPMIHYLRDGDGNVRELTVEDDFYYSGAAAEWWNGSSEGLLHRLPVVVPARGPITIEEVLDLLPAQVPRSIIEPSTRGTSWWRRALRRQAQP